MAGKHPSYEEQGVLAEHRAHPSKPLPKGYNQNRIDKISRHVDSCERCKPQVQAAVEGILEAEEGE